MCHVKLIAQLKRLAVQNGGHIERDESAYQVCAPVGKRWSDGSHALCVPYRPDWPAEWKRSNLVDGINRLKVAALQDCQDPECDCRETE